MPGCLRRWRTVPKYGLAYATAAIPDPEHFEAPLYRAGEQRAEMPIPGGAAPPPGHLLYRAAQANQTLERGAFAPVWTKCLARRNKIDEMPDYVGQGLLGLRLIGQPFNLSEVDHAVTRTHWPGVKWFEEVAIWSGGFRFMLKGVPPRASYPMIQRVAHRQTWPEPPISGLATALGFQDHLALIARILTFPG